MTPGLLRGQPLLDVHELRIDFSPPGAAVTKALDAFSLQIHEGTVAGLLGESGCGKTTFALSLVRLLPEVARIDGGRVLFAGEELLSAPERRLREVRGAGIAYVFQDPALALCPVRTVGDQLADTLRVRGTLARRQVRAEAVQLLARVRLPEPSRAYSAYPHQLSGGERQRVAIALALACRPRLLVLDEPTAALDAPLREEIADLMGALRREQGMTLLWIAHDPDVLRRVADDVAVMRAGRVVESGRAADVLDSPRLDYTSALVGTQRGLNPGSAFLGRLLEARGVRKQFLRRTAPTVDGVDLDLARGETLGLVGPSGAGKSTLARCLLRLEHGVEGRVAFDGVQVLSLSRRALRGLRPRMQIVFQEPARALNPRLTASEAVSEPWRVQGQGTSADRRRDAVALMESVGLDRSCADRRPLELSGGERQRVALARALALKPDLLVLDEALSALDRRAQAELVQVLGRLQAERHLAYLLISHDEALVDTLAHRTCRMAAGRIVWRVPAAGPRREAGVGAQATLPVARRAPLARAALRRLLDGVLILALVGLASFALLDLAPGDYLDEMRMNPQVSAETVGALRARYGLDQPLLGRYARWLGSLAAGDWGLSFAYDTPVRPLVLQRARNTLLLGVAALAVSWSVALPLGTWWATRTPGTLADATGRAGTLALVCMPEMLLALALLWLSVETGAFPTGARLEPAEGWAAGVLDLARRLTLPVLALTLGSLGGLVRHVRASVSEVLTAPFVLALRARGMPENRLLWRYVLPTAANPLLTLFGFSVGALLSASITVEVVMGWPGLGPLLLEAVLARDLFVVIGCVLVAAVFVVAGNALADALLYWNDPRLRGEGRS